jgi:hypothetical protein
MILLIGYPLSARESFRLLLSYLEEAFSIQYRISGLEYLKVNSSGQFSTYDIQLCLKNGQSDQERNLTMWEKVKFL